MLQSKSPIEVLANRVPHANGVTWVFQDLATGFVRHVNVSLVAQQQLDWASKIAEVMRDQFGLKPNQQNLMYRTPYPAVYDQLPLPHKYKLPDFTKFYG